MFAVESEKVELRWKGNKERNDHLRTGNSITSKQSNNKVSTSKDGEDERVEDKNPTEYLTALYRL